MSKDISLEEDLMESIRHKDVKSIKGIIELGANVNFEEKRNWSWTPIMLASAEGLRGAAIWLLEKGADINFADDNGWTPLMTVTRWNHIEMVKLYLEKERNTNMDAQDDAEQMTALMIASKWGYIEIVQLLIDAGANIYTTDEDGWTALTYAIGYNNIEIEKLLKQAMEAQNDRT